MPTRSPARSWPQRRAKRFARHVRVASGRIGRKPFPRLVRHFLDRLTRGGDTESAEVEFGIGALLGLLAAPGAFQAFLMLDKYSSLMGWFRGTLREDLVATSAPDKYMFLAIAMGLTGIATILKWDRLLPDAQDYLNLAPLPVGAKAVFLANASALGIAIGVLAFTVNAISTLLFPMFVTSAMMGTGVPGVPPPPAILSFLAAHAVSVLLASVFAFCSVIGTLGLIRAVLPKLVFQAVSAWIRGVFLSAFLAVLVSGFAARDIFVQLRFVPDTLVRWLPPLWFTGLYQTLQGRATSRLHALAPWAVYGVAVSALVMIAGYALSYRRSFAVTLEGSAQPSRQRGMRMMIAGLNLFAPRTAGFECAAYGFTIRTLLRNESQRLCLTVALTLGWLLAVQSGLTATSNVDSLPDATGFLAAPFLAAYALILGIRVAFDFPAPVGANWIFRSVLDSMEHESIGVARRVMIALLIPAVLAPAFVWAWPRLTWKGAALHTAFLFALSLALIELVLQGYRRIPFTCVMLGFQQNLPVQCLIAVGGIVVFSQTGARADSWLLLHPWFYPAVPLAMAAVWRWNQSRLREARDAGELEEGISFDTRLAPAVQRLRLFDGD